MWEIKQHLQKNEKIVYEGSPSRVGFISHFIWLLVSLILLIAGFMLSINGKPANMIEKEIFGFWGLMAILWVIFTVIGSFRLILERISIKYVVTDKRLITRLGILSENFKSAESLKGEV